MTIFFIADMHFGSASNAKWRGFSSVSAMDDAVVSAWRSRVSEGDTVWVLGDIGSLDPLRGLPGSKHLIFGNNDRPKKPFAESGLFESHAYEHVLETEVGPLFLVHRPGDAPDNGLPVIHGHTHAKPPEPDPRFVSVSVDQTGWGPISLEDLHRRLQARMAGLENLVA